MSKLSIVMLCGAGGCGKSTVAERIKEDYANVLVMRSSSRLTYARLGISTETAALSMSVADQQHLQDEIMSDHLKQLYVAAQQAKEKGHGNLVVDRSPLDHMAYWTRTNALDVNSSHAQFLARLGHVMQVINDLEANYIGWFDFPYPVPWPTADGMRDQNEIKTFEMSLLTSAILARYYDMPWSRNFLYSIPENVHDLDSRIHFIVKHSVYLEKVR